MPLLILIIQAFEAKNKINMIYKYMGILDYIKRFFNLFAGTPQPTVVSKGSTAPKVGMISKEELLKGRDQQYPNDYTQEISDNLDKLLVPMNEIRAAYGKSMTVNSGWRPPSINGSTPGAAAHSKHMLGLAADISDPDGALWAWVLQNLALMQKLGIYFEDKRWTPDWVHFGLGAPASGKRIFVPSASRATAPDAWDGNYDHQYDGA